MIEQSNEIVRRINRQAGREVLPEARALVFSVGRLPGIDGRSKMSKSAGNAIPLSASPEEDQPRPSRPCSPDPDAIYE